MDHCRPAFRPPPLRLRINPAATQPEEARCTLINTTDHSSRQSQRIPRSPLGSNAYTPQGGRSISSLPQSPSSLSPVSSHGGLTSPVGSIASSVGSYSTARSSLPRAPPTLRRKISPTETSLREIRASQQRLQMKQQSEDRLRQVYERQTMEYLYGDFACLDTLME